MTLQRFRQIEFWVITALTALFLLIFLWFDYIDYAYVFREINSLEETRISFQYNWWINGFWAYFSLATTLYGCWYALTYLVFPYFERQSIGKFFSFYAIVGAILIVGVWSYLYLYKDIQVRYNTIGEIIGAKVPSFYRLRNIVMMGSGLLFLISLYVSLSQLYQWAIQQTENEDTPNLKVIKDGSRLALIGFGFINAFQLLNHDSLLIPSLIWVQGAFIHAYLYHYNIFRLKTFTLNRNRENQESRRKLLTTIGVSFGSSIILSLTYEVFRFQNPYYIALFKIEGILAFWIISWLGALAVTLIRQFMVKPLETNLNRNQAELSALRAQINPHFLFNAMNTLYATAIEENAEKTSHGIQQLSDMMRFMMHENNQEQIDVQQEVAYLRNYIDLQRLRLSESDKLELKVELDDALCLRSIAPMLLIPFVENAFKHGISLRNSSWIFVRLYCQQEKLHFSVFNSIHPRHEEDPEKFSSGIGLVNVQKRLELLYPKNHDLRIHRTEKEFSVQLAIDFSKKGKKLNSILTTYGQL